MITETQFSIALRRTILDCFSMKGTDTKSIALKMLKRIPKRPAYSKEKHALIQFIKERDIKEIVHFTHLSNVSNILKYGLIPREHLEEELLRIYLNPKFTDDFRFDGSPISNCLSFTFPNYGMFYKKRLEAGTKIDWAVISFVPEVIVDYYCEFFVGNAASSSPSSHTAQAAQLLFSNLSIRKLLGLHPSETTNPQAEIQEDSVIHPSHIFKIYVQNQKALDYLASRVKSANNLFEINDHYYHPRRDFSHWQQKKDFTPKNDYDEVLMYERNIRY